MIMEKILKRDGFVFFDGAMGTMLQQAGLQLGDFPEKYNFTMSETVQGIYRSYMDAGAEILTSNTFSSNDYKLEGAGFSVEESIKKGIEIAKQVAEDKLVALDIGPTGQLLAPMGTLSFDEAYSMFKKQIVAGERAGADIVLIETMTDLYEAKAAVLAAKENCSLPVVSTMSFQQDGRTLSGADPLTCILVLEGLGVDVIGINCSLGPFEMIPIVEKYLQYSHIPVIVQPNAGMPRLEAGETVFGMGPEEFADNVLKMAQMGVKVIGGCCGTTPDYIRQVKSRLEGVKAAKPEALNITAVSSGARTVVMGEDVVVIGERINPTGKKKLKEALKQHDYDYILNEAVNQKEAGALILDVNCGLPEIDEEAVMVRLIREIQAIIDLPLQIDSTRADVIEKGLRYYNGKALVNSVNGEKKSLETILPAVKKYGACVLGLTLDENGIPPSAEGRFKVAEKILKAVKEYGIPEQNLLIDCLVLTASAQQEAVMETVKAVRMVKERLGLKTILGISNVSFGLPRRDILNRTYLAMALACGLDAAILNPMSRDMMETVHGFEVLSNMDRESTKFVSIYSASSPQADVQPGVKQERQLEDVVVNGIREEAAKLTTELLNRENPMDIIEKRLMPALDIVGSRYEKGEIFLPQLMQSAETVKRAFAVIKDHFLKTGVERVSKGKVLLATVKGDIHDIGKNIVKLLLENYGYDVIDMGKDVSPEAVLKGAKEHQVSLVGLSALMTTTLKSMEETICLLHDSSMPCKVMVGGAVLSPAYAERINADYYGKDAGKAVRFAKEVYGK